MLQATPAQYAERLLDGSATLRSLAAEAGTSYQAVSAKLRRAGFYPDQIRQQVITSTRGPQEPPSPKRHCRCCGKQLIISERGVKHPERPSWCADNRECQNDRYRFLYWNTDRREKHKQYAKANKANKELN